MSTEVVERAAVVALLCSGGRSWSQVAADVLDAESAVTLLRDSSGQPDLFSAGPEDLLADAARQVASWQAAGIGVHSVLDDSYPALLRDIRDRPPILFTKGTLAADTRAIAVVGSRKASQRGLRIAGTIAGELAKQDITVVSGLAQGIDAAAHRAALASDGRTVAVIGTGINRCHPSAHRWLQDEIADRGLVISQFWPDAPPRRENFPIRNAVTSGYSAATVVVEAGERSGTRIQARLALEHGRQVILLADLLQLEWARTMAERPGVTVAQKPDDLFGAVEAVLEQRAQQLAPAHDFVDLVFS